MEEIEIKEQLIQIKFNSSDHIALWKLSSEKSKIDKNVLLTHGTFSNRKVLKGISEYLTTQGFTCWIFEWRNHGSSSKTKEQFNFETIGKEDFNLVFNYLFEVENIKNLNCITHSGGGICLTIALSHFPQYQSKIQSITMFACQAFGAGSSFKNYFKIWLGKMASLSLGYVPARKTGSEENEDYSLMKQWFNWNLSGHFKGTEGFDYKQEMKNIQTPVLSIYGKGDHLIAPPIGCENFLSSFENPINQLLFCSKENGFSENYNHSRILHSRNASKEIYPKVLDWIYKNQDFTRIKVNSIE